MVQRRIYQVFGRSNLQPFLRRGTFVYGRNLSFINCYFLEKYRVLGFKATYWYINLPAVNLHQTTRRRIPEYSSFFSVTAVTSSDITCRVLMLSVNIFGNGSFGFPINP